MSNRASYCRPRIPGPAGFRVGLLFILVLCLGGFALQSPRIQAEKPTAVDSEIRLCQVLRMGPSSNNHPRSGVKRRCAWENARLGAWQAYAQGEYTAHPRTAHVREYRLRVGDQLDMIYHVTHEETSKPYQLNIGDTIRLESNNKLDPKFDRELVIQPDGTVIVPQLGSVRATGRTITQLQKELLEKYDPFFPGDTFELIISPVVVNSKLESLRAAIDKRAGAGGQGQLVRITPEGTISLPIISSVMAQGLTIRELEQEVLERYREVGMEGMGITPSVVEEAPRYIYVLGEVKQSGRFELVGPTTVLQAIAMAGSYNNGANLQQVVIFRRGDDWRLMATIVNIEATMRGNQACPAGEIWLSDSDVIILPKNKILLADDFIELVFTRGLYGVFPIGPTLNFSKLSAL